MKKYTIKSLFLACAIIVTSCKNDTTIDTIEGKAKKEIISFAPKVTGRILKIYVQEGQVVKPGDTLAMLDVPEVTAKIAQAKGATKAAKAQAEMAKNGATIDQLRQLKAKQKGLEQQYEFAQKSFKRAQNMYKDSLMSAQSYDEIYAKLQGAKAQYEAVNAELHDVVIGTRLEKIEMTLGQEQQANGALQEANVAYSERYIIATNTMEIETITLHQGELATAGYALFNGYIPQTTYFRFTIPESKIAQYKKGNTVTIEIPYAKQSLQGEVTYIKQLTRYADITTAYPEYQMQEAVYEIKVKPLNPSQANEVLVNANIILK